MLSVLMKRALLLILGATAAAGLTPAMCSAESATVGANEQTIMQELKALEDSTILKRRIWSDTEWNKYKDGSDDIVETLGGLWAWRVSESRLGSAAQSAFQVPHRWRCSQGFGQAGIGRYQAGDGHGLPGQRVVAYRCRC